MDQVIERRRSSVVEQLIRKKAVQAILADTTSPCAANQAHPCTHQGEYCEVHGHTGHFNPRDKRYGEAADIAASMLPRPRDMEGAERAEGVLAMMAQEIDRQQAIAAQPPIQSPDPDSETAAALFALSDTIVNQGQAELEEMRALQERLAAAENGVGEQKEQG